MIPSTTATRHGTAVRAALWVAAVLGAFLIVFPLAIGLPGKSAASGDLMSAMRPMMTDQALAQGRADQSTMASMSSQLTGKMIPTLATQLGMTPQQLNAYFGQNLPATARGLGEVGTLQASFGGMQSLMEQQQANFRQADQIPTSFMPPTTMTSLFLVPGIVLVLVAAIGLVRPRRARQMVAATGVVAIVMSAGLLATSMYGKASAADEMTAAFRPVFAASSIQQTQALTADASAMATELTQKALPAFAAALHVSPSQLAAGMATSYPAVTAGMQELPGIIGRMDGAATLIATQKDNFDQTAAIPWTPGSMVGVFWSMMAPALLILVVAAGTLLAATGTAPQARRTVLRPGAQH